MRLTQQRAVPLPEFQRFQYAFSAHIRDPIIHPCPPGIEARRMNIYNQLLYNNTEGFLLACFPVLHSVVGEHKWAELGRAFFSTHRSRSPYFRQIPDEFMQYLQTEWTRAEDYPAYVLELAHYEWIELVLTVSNRAPAWEAIDVDGDLLEQCPALNPVLANLFYHWPVQRIKPGVNITPQDTYLLVFRDTEDRVQFVEINAFTARLMQLLEPGTVTGLAALEAVATESRHPDPATVIRGGLATMQDLTARGAIIGTARSL